MIKSQGVFSELIHRARPGQIPRIELARFTRVVSRCASCGRRERIGVRCRAARIFNKSAVLGVGWRDSARMVRHPSTIFLAALDSVPTSNLKK
jgi:hypothetical protein